MIRTQMHIDAPPERVFDVLADGGRYADWVVGARQIRAVEGRFPRRGARLHHTLGVAPLVLRDETRVVRSDPPRLLELDAHAGPVRATVRFLLHPDPTGTTVVMEEEGGDPKSRAVAGMARPLVAARNAETLWRLREQVETGGDLDRSTAAPIEGRAALPRWAADTAARAFGLLAAVRGRRALHPRGVTFRGSAWAVSAPGALLTGGQACEVVARFSRGLGLPAPLPDVHGLALRFVDVHGPGRHQDLLFATTGLGPLERLPAPTTEFGTDRYSTVLPYRLAGDPVLLRAAVPGGRRTLDRLESGETLEVGVSTQARGAERTDAVRILLTAPVDGGGVRFDPRHTGPDAVPMGILNALRAPAYAASQAVRADA